MGIDRIYDSLNLKKFISAGSFKNISTLMTGTILAAIIPIITSPIMSRLFEPKDYGILGLYLSVTTLIGVIAFSHYSQAIMFVKTNEESKNVVWFSLAFCFLVCISFFIVLLFLNQFTGLIENSALKFWYFMAPISIMLNGITAILMVWANRTKRYSTLARNRIIQAVLTAIVQIFLGLYYHSAIGLMVGLLTGQSLSALLLFRLFIKGEFSIGKPDLNNFGMVANSYKKLLLFSTPTEFINNFINQAPVFLLQKYGGVSYVGNFNFTQRFLGLPQLFISSSFVDVFRQKASSHCQTLGNCRDVFVKTFKILTLLAVPPLIILIAFAPQIFSFFFGQRWHEAGVYAQFLSILFFFRFVVSPLTYVYILAGKLKEDFLLHLLFLVIIFLSFYFSAHLLDKKYMILSYSITYSIVYVIYLIRSYQFSSNCNSVWK